MLRNLPKIQVIVRKRPVSKKEQQKKDPDIIQTTSETSVIVQELKQKVDLTKYIEEHLFNFDRAFCENATNEQIYASTIKPLIQAAFQAYKVTVFAYGQTGSGKTHTMLGDIDNQVPGLYLLACYDIFSFLQQAEFQHLQCYVSFYEIYCGKLFDLLNERAVVQAREDQKGSINIVGLQEKHINSVQSLMQLIEFGSTNRITGVNSANSDSSRSHAILQINLREGSNIYGKMSFIDLAGNERGADVSGSDKQTRIDGAEINKSLLALKECIRALDQNKNYLPFRQSKLTLVLKDSFIGNCKTVMIGNISPCQSSSEHTLNTLRYADRVKELKNPPQPQQQLSELDQLQKELMLSRQQNNTVKYDIKKLNQFEQQQQQQGDLEFSPFLKQNISSNQNDNKRGSLSNLNLMKNQSQPQPRNDKRQSTYSNHGQQQNGTQLNNLLGQQQQQQQFQLQVPSSNNNNNNNLKNMLNIPSYPDQVKSKSFNNLNNILHIPVSDRGSQNSNNIIGAHSSTTLTDQVNLQQQQQQQQQQVKQQGNRQNRSKSPFQQRNSIPSVLDHNIVPQQVKTNNILPQSHQIQPINFFSIGSANMQNPLFNKQQQQQQNLNNIILNNRNLNNNQTNNMYQQQKQQQQQKNIIQNNNNTNSSAQNNANIVNNSSNIEQQIQIIQSFEAKNEEDLQNMQIKHEQLIGLILAEEEGVMQSHRYHIDDNVELVKEEMNLLNEVDKPGSDVDEYLENVQSVLTHKMQLIQQLKDKISGFQSHLVSEEQLSQRFQQQKNVIYGAQSNNTTDINTNTNSNINLNVNNISSISINNNIQQQQQIPSNIYINSNDKNNNNKILDNI